MRMVQLPKGPAGPSNDVVLVTTFDFRAMVESLLNDPLLTQNLDHLDVDHCNPFGPYKPDMLAQSNSGVWYANPCWHNQIVVCGMQRHTNIYVLSQVTCCYR